MRKTFAAILSVFILSVSLVIPVFAESKIEIKNQPQNATFPENAVASWSVEATGEGLSYKWFIVYKDVAYDTSVSFAEQHPWQDGITGEGFGTNNEGNQFYINGIGNALDGAEIYCVISNKTDKVTSQSAYITVGGTKIPPQLKVVAKVNIVKDKILKLYCEATAADGDEIKSYMWYETETGKLKDIVSLGAKEGIPEEDPILVCDTTKYGTRYYVCYVETELGGKAYTSVIPVTVYDPNAPAETPKEDPDPVDATDKPAETPLPGSLTENKKTPDTNGVQQSETVKPERTTEKGLSIWLLVLIAAGSAALGSGVAIAVMLIIKKNRSRRQK